MKLCNKPFCIFVRNNQPAYTYNQMETHPSKSCNFFLAVTAVVAWFAVGLQFYLIILNRVTSIPETIIRYFSFYTILTNILVALYVTALLLKPNSSVGKFLTRSGPVTALVLYISVVGIIYNLVLRQLWKPEGWQRVADELLHVIVPLLIIFYWIFWANRAGLKWKNIFSWLVYPLVYLCFILLRGAFSGFYPYPFINVTVLGYNKVFINSGGLLVIFFVLSGLFIIIAKMSGTKSGKGLGLRA